MATYLFASLLKLKVYKLTLKHSRLGLCGQRALDLFSVSAFGTAWSQLTSDSSKWTIGNGNKHTQRDKQSSTYSAPILQKS